MLPPDASAQMVAGTPPPRRRPPVENSVVAMAIFVSAEVMLFGGLISAFLILRAGSTGWPPVDQPRLPVLLTLVNTLILAATLPTMWQAADAERRRARADALYWLQITAVGGLVFLLIQGFEWVRLLGYGLRASRSLYAATFYTVVGTHGLHLLAAVVALSSLIVQMRRANRFAMVRSIDAYRLYWCFVVAIWPVLYVLVYLT